MEANPFLGLILHSIGGLAAASFYLPYKLVKKWSWEAYWLVGGFFSWIVAPWLLAIVITPQAPEILLSVPLRTLALTWFFGVLWGVGGLTFGLTMRYLGIALGYAIALGLCAAFGTLMPPLVSGELADVAMTTSGRVMLAGVLICLAGIALSGKAGIRKEKELTDEQKKATVSEFNLVKGLFVAIFSGVMSASMAYGFSTGKPIAEVSLKMNVPHLWQNLPVLIVVLLGGFTTNFIWCLYLIAKNKRVNEFYTCKLKDHKSPLLSNYIFCMMAGFTWYMQFFFYGMGSTKMGAFEFSSWTLHMASIIIFSTLWGIFLKEWKGTGKATKIWITSGLIVLILSTIVIGIGNKLAMDVVNY